MARDMGSRRFKVGGGGGAVSGTPVDLVMNFEAGTPPNGMTSTDYDNCTTKSAAAAGTWTVPFSNIVSNSVSQFDLGTRRCKVGSTQVGNTILLGRADNDVPQRIGRYTLDAGKDCAQASLGFFLNVINQGTFNFYNWGEMTGTNGKYNALHHRDNSPSQLGCEDDLSNIGTLITIASATSYWVTMLYDLTNTIIKLRVYDSSWALVGAESSLSIAGHSYTNFKSFMIGRTDNHGANGTGPNYLDYVVMCLSTGVGATYPLLPT